jgi:Carboxypeptidase regulatory-like domain/Secretion system C-terminal sorting domain
VPSPRSRTRRGRFTLAPAAAVAVLLVAVLALPSLSLAGTICGSVHDAATGLPVPRAGVFVRDATGAYTGFYAATDDSGDFCIGGLVAGTYDLDVRVDDYRIGYVPGVQVTEGVTSVPPIDGELAVRLLAPEPNPARETVTLRWSLAAPGPVSLRVIDLSGRLIQGWSSPREDAGNHTLSWNFRSLDRSDLPSGIYFLVLDAAGVRRVRTVVRLP